MRNYSHRSAVRGQHRIRRREGSLALYDVDATADALGSPRGHSHLDAFPCGAARPRMKRNVGRIDALARVAGGAALAVLAFLVASGEASVPVGPAVGLGIAGAVLIVEGSTRRCLLYRALGIDRCPVE